MEECPRGLPLRESTMAVYFGDTSGSLSGNKKAHVDYLTGDFNTTNYLYGDAGQNLLGFARGAADILTGGNGNPDRNDGIPTFQGTPLENYIYGDAGGSLRGLSRGGDDQITGGS